MVFRAERLICGFNSSQNSLSYSTCLFCFGLHRFFETRSYCVDKMTSNKRHFSLSLLSAGITGIYHVWLDMFKFLSMIRKYPFVSFSSFLKNKQINKHKHCSLYSDNNCGLCVDPVGQDTEQQPLCSYPSLCVQRSVDPGSA